MSNSEKATIANAWKVAEANDHVWRVRILRNGKAKHQYVRANSFKVHSRYLLFYRFTDQWRLEPYCSFARGTWEKVVADKKSALFPSFVVRKSKKGNRKRF